jgi:hypothetical protein
MVHALRDAWRVLGPDGTLIDLRPLSGFFPIDVIAGFDATGVAEADSTEGTELDRAADRAIAAKAEEGWLVPRHHTEFDIHFYWNTTAEMADYMTTSRTMKRVTPSYPDIDAALQAASARAGAPGRLRCTRRMMLGSYGKGLRR